MTTTSSNSLQAKCQNCPKPARHSVVFDDRKPLPGGGYQTSGWYPICESCRPREEIRLRHLPPAHIELDFYSTTVTDLISGKQRTLASRIPCDSWTCKEEHVTLRCGPGFASYHGEPGRTERVAGGSTAPEVVNLPAHAGASERHSQQSHGGDYGSFLTCAECAGEGGA